jgi:hypothetical protein
MAKAPPSFQFYPGDWLRDPELSLCRPATRGVWIDLLCAIHQLDRSGELRGTTEQLARIARCRTEELADALTDLQTTGTADVRERNGIVTVTSRRMKRDANERRKWRDQKQTQRKVARENPVEFATRPDKVHPCVRDDKPTAISDIADCPQNVRNMSGRCPPVSSIFSLHSPCSPPAGNGANGDLPVSVLVDLFLAAYPAHRRGKRETVVSALLRLHPDRTLFERIHKALETFKESDEWRREDGRWIPGAAKWLESRAWESGLASREEIWQEPAGSDPRPPNGMRWKTDCAGKLIHPLEAVPA